MLWLTHIGNSARGCDKDGNATGISVAGETWGYGYNGRGRLTVVEATCVWWMVYIYGKPGQQ
ncbi:hypothetical protein GCM10007898_26800 [Dyella flagellata]|uniref:YD repeat-containing protein n=1 Tax=Dyella flagellata TaxID=1867833 RepID=A0ABQ5XDD5_9GAMM|nr:hypothetical protein GCM10007898_26800 [Dyella flagellata]